MQHQYMFLENKINKSQYYLLIYDLSDIYISFVMHYVVKKKEVDYQPNYTKIKNT